MKIIGITEAQKRFEELFEMAKAGEVIVITEYGKPVAQMIRDTSKDTSDKH